MNIYIYNGPVMRFGICIANKWSSSTRAISKDKARSNLEYQFKKNNNLVARTSIHLPGEITLIRSVCDE